MEVRHRVGLRHLAILRVLIEVGLHEGAVLTIMALFATVVVKPCRHGRLLL